MADPGFFMGVKVETPVCYFGLFFSENGMKLKNKLDQDVEGGNFPSALSLDLSMRCQNMERTLNGHCLKTCLF